MDFGSFFVQLVTAGNDTTKTMMSSGLLALLDHPEQLAALRDDPALIPLGRRGDPALGQPAALLPADGDGRHRTGGQDHQGRRQAGHDVHLGQP